MSSFFSTLNGRRVAFIGAGVSHRELIPMFASAGARVTLCDKKERAALGPYGGELAALGVRLCLGGGYLAGLAGQEMILRTPGFGFFTPELQAAGAAGAELTSEMELFFEHCPCPITGVTGSDGKTTTTSLIAAMYAAAGHRVHLGGNIGRALLPIVDDIAPGDVAVVELSSFQLVSMRRSPQVAVVTNVTPNHLDHHKDMREYIDAKRNILLYQGPGSRAVLGWENDITRGMAADAHSAPVWFSRLRALQNGAFLRDDGMLCYTCGSVTTELMHQSEVKLRGAHNIENLLAAWAAVRGAVGDQFVLETARSFAGVEHRIEPVRTLRGVQWFNDSIATSPTRVVAGLRAFGQRLIVIAGGHDKNLDYTPMVPDMLKRVKLLILTGPSASKIEAALRADPAFAASGLAILHAENMADAVQLAAEHARDGDIVTLSPACASFDAYDNFEARGRHYKALVNALP